MQKSSKLALLVECAILLGLAAVLSEYTKIIRMPWGGSVTVLSMLPVCLAAIRHGVKWGLGTALLYSVIQLLFGLKNLSYANSAAVAVAIVALDYIIPFTALGLAGIFRKKGFEGQLLGVIAAVTIRFACHFLTGIFIWGQWREGMWAEAPAWVYSLAYNSAYMLPEIIFTGIGAALVLKAMQKMKLSESYSS